MKVIKGETEKEPKGKEKVEWAIMMQSEDAQAFHDGFKNFKKGKRLIENNVSILPLGQGRFLYLRLVVIEITVEEKNQMLLAQSLQTNGIKGNG